MRDNLDHSISAERLHEIYDRTAAFYDEVVAAHQAAAKEIGVRLLARQTDERFLELGVGTGWAFEKAITASGGQRAIGVDAASGMLTVARERVGRETGAAFALADARFLPFRDGSFDCLFCSYTLEVLATGDIAVVLAEVRRVLRPGGRAVVIDLTEGETDDAAFTEDWRERFVKDPEYFGGARPLRLVPLLTEAGLIVIERVYSGHGASWPSEVVLAQRSS